MVQRSLGPHPRRGQPLSGGDFWIRKRLSRPRKQTHRRSHLQRRRPKRRIVSPRHITSLPHAPKMRSVEHQRLRLLQRMRKKRSTLMRSRTISPVLGRVRQHELSQATLLVRGRRRCITAGCHHRLSLTPWVVAVYRTLVITEDRTLGLLLPSMAIPITQIGLTLLAHCQTTFGP